MNLIKTSFFFLSIFLLSSLLLIDERGSLRHPASITPDTCISNADQLITSQVQEVIRSNEFKVDRSLKDYILQFQGLDLKLQSAKHWLDAGGGNGLPVMDYFGGKEALWSLDPTNTLNTKANVTIVSFEMSHDKAKIWKNESGEFAPIVNQKVKLFEERYFEDIDPTEITNQFGKVDLITDLFGVLSYTHDPSLALSHYFDILSDEGKAFVLTRTGIVGIDVHTVLTKSGKKISLLDWIRQLPQFEVKVIQTWIGPQFRLPLVNC